MLCGACTIKNLLYWDELVTHTHTHKNVIFFLGKMYWQRFEIIPISIILWYYL